MNPRERLFATVVLVFIMLFAGAFLVYEFYLVPRNDRRETIHKLQADNATKQDFIDKVEQQAPKMRQARELSLPSDVGHSSLEYENFLAKLIKDSGLSLGASGFKLQASMTAQSGSGPSYGTKKESFLTPLTFRLSGRTDLEHLVTLLEHFYGAPVLHRIKSLTIRQPSSFGATAVKLRDGARSRDLDVDMMIEGVIVSGTTIRTLTASASRPAVHPRGTASRPDIHPASLVSGPAVPPTGSAIEPAVHVTVSAVARSLARLPAAYTAMLQNNIFYGPPPPPLRQQEGPDITKSIQLVLITHLEGEDERGCEAYLWNETDKTFIRLCPKEGKESFQYLNNLREVRVQGTVVRIGEKDMVFRVGDDLYRIDIDETLDKALARKPLTDAQLRAINLTRGPGSGGPR